MQFKDNVVVVTGAASGMGLATCRAFAAEGALVYGIDISADSLSGEFAEIPNAHACPVDIADPSKVGEVFEQIASTWGRVDVLVNAASKGTTDEAEQNLLLSLIEKRICESVD